jgi:hypothetical protein
VNYFTRDRRGRKLCSKPPFGIHVAEVVPDQKRLSLTLTLRAGQRYCCSSIRCGFPPNWDDLRWWLAQAGIEMGYPMQILLRETCEPGARIAEIPSDLSTCKPVEEGWEEEASVVNEDETDS